MTPTQLPAAPTPLASASTGHPGAHPSKKARERERGGARERERGERERGGERERERESGRTDWMTHT